MGRTDISPYRPAILPYYRILGYIVTISMHAINSYVMLRGFRGVVMNDPNIQLFATFMFKFITCWTFLAQSIHAALGLSCDLLTLLIGDQYKFLKYMKKTRNVLFASIVVPFSCMVSTWFWPIFLYNRELVLPLYTTKIVGSVSNHIMHTAIIPATLWEMYFQDRKRLASHKQNVSLMLAFSASYLIVIFISFFETGMFPYPLMTMLYGSVYFVVLLAFVLACLPIYYFGQWHISDWMWREDQKGMKAY